MKKYLKTLAVAFLAGVGAARVCVWINTAIIHLLVMCGGWDVAEAIKAACAVRTGNAAAASGIPARRAALPVQLNL